MPCSRRMYLLDRQQMWSDELCLGINCALAGDISLALNYPPALSESRQSVASSATERAVDPDAACKAAAGSGARRPDPARKQRVRIVGSHRRYLHSSKDPLELWGCFRDLAPTSRHPRESCPTSPQANMKRPSQS